MNADQLRHLMQGLLFATAITHLIVGLLNLSSPIAGAFIIFGVLYGALAFWFLRTPSEKPGPVFGAIIACAIGLTSGSIGAVVTGASVALFAMLIIDVVIIGAGLVWLSKRRKA